MAESAEIRLIDLHHPLYDRNIEDWNLYRLVYEGGSRFINTYLQKFSKLESDPDFETRKSITYNPSYAEAAVNDVKNSIFQRMIDISREGGTQKYQDAVSGKNGGVDLIGSSMNYFIGQKILPEMLTMRKVGVYVDMPPTDGMTLLDVEQHGARPYLYIYEAENIQNWIADYTAEPNEYTCILLREKYNVMHKLHHLPHEIAERYRYMYINPETGYVMCCFYNMEGVMVDENGNAISEPIQLNIKKIPFVVFEISKSLLCDAARYQIALLNVESSDIAYVLKANVPLYTEQRDMRAASPYTKQPGTENTENTSGGSEITTGVTGGRVYAKDMERPGWVHPSSEPLKASMEKQEQMKMGIRQLINLALTTLAPNKQASAESKSLDNQGLEAGLSCIGLELERGERRIAEFWSMYEGKQDVATIHYPIRYNLKSDDERRAESEQYVKVLPAIASKTYQREVAKCLARSILAYKVAAPIMEKIESEIDTAEIINANPEVINKDVQDGILDKENAAKAKLYPEDAVEKANKEHAERLATIAEHQQKNLGAPGSRGVPDASGNPKKDAKEEKDLSRSKDPAADPASKVRGEGK